MRVKRSASKEECEYRRSASREGTLVEKECEWRRSARRRSASREGVRIKKKCE